MSTIQPKEVKKQEHIKLDKIIFIHIHVENYHCAEKNLPFLQYYFQILLYEQFHTTEY